MRSLSVARSQSAAGVVVHRHERGCAGGAVPIRRTLAKRGRRGSSSTPGECARCAVCIRRTLAKRGGRRSSSAREGMRRGCGLYPSHARKGLSRVERQETWRSFVAAEGRVPKVLRARVLCTAVDVSAQAEHAKTGSSLRGFNAGAAQLAHRGQQALHCRARLRRFRSCMQQRSRVPERLGQAAVTGFGGHEPQTLFFL